MQTRKWMEAPIPERLNSTFIFNLILTLIAFIFLSVLLFNLVTEYGPGSDADAQIILNGEIGESNIQ